MGKDEQHFPRQRSRTGHFYKANNVCKIQGKKRLSTFQLKARVWEKTIHKAGKACRSLIVGTPESHLEAL